MIPIPSTEYWYWDHFVFWMHIEVIVLKKVLFSEVQKAANNLTIHFFIAVHVVVMVVLHPPTNVKVTFATG